MALQILTANRLSDGCVVWYAGHGDWVEEMSQAMVAHNEDDKIMLEAQAQAAISANLVVEATLIDVAEGGDAYHALRLRERIREKGPSIAYGLSARHYGKDEERKTDVSL